MNRSHVLWIPRQGSGKVRSFLLRPGYLRVLLTVVLLCLASIPVLESGVLSLAERIMELEEARGNLQEEIARLEYVKGELARITEKEQRLKDYFGMARFRSLEQVVGGGPDQTASVVAKALSASAPAALPERLENLAGNLEALGELMIRQAAAWDETPSIFPVDLKDPVISSGFGWRKSPFTNKREFHAGIDIIGRTGTRVVAPAAGSVINRGHDRWLGNYVVLQHAGDLKTIYGHLHEASVEKGARVKRGDVIGLVGNTGLSTSSHLHYSVVEGSRAVNPMQYILDVSA
ncbi:MAG: M23 family metallopeptidase [Deltaproteobacteria bacterium]|nr:M23 family metallopeptidase [Deltaproteobacteria bacterium]